MDREALQKAYYQKMTKKVKMTSKSPKRDDVSKHSTNSSKTNYQINTNLD